MTTNQSVQAKLDALKQEFTTGEEHLAELVRREAGLRETLLRISGAIQVLQELLEDPTPATTPQARVPEPGTVLTVS